MSKKNRSAVSLVEVLTRLAEQRALWQPLIRFDPISRHYARLASERDFEAWLLTWVPGQGTDWHDHGGSAGAFITVQGTLTEQQAMVRSDGPPRVVPGRRELPAGALRPFGTKHIHKVTNNALEPAVSLHVYSPALVEMNAYQVNAGGLLQLADSQLVGRNW
jgi:predicted metal-dependent enzyme (double-stranded beta helix superfamily)